MRQASIESEMKNPEQLPSSKCSQSNIFISPKFNHTLKEVKDKEQGNI